jgi:hypothetical protein
VLRNTTRSAWPKDIVIEPSIHSEDLLDAFFVQAIDFQNKDDELTGYAISVVYTSPSSLRYVEQLARKEKVSDEFQLEMKFELKDKAVYRSQQTYVCSPDELDSILDRIVADIDVQLLEPAREASQYIRKQLKSRHH